VSKPLELRIERDRTSPRIAVAGELDLASAGELEAELKTVESSNPELVVLDLRELEFMDSTGLRTLLAAHARAQDRGARLIVVRPPSEVGRVLQVTRMDEHLELVDEPPQK
jgi:anti-sigma B factor antagonist